MRIVDLEIIRVEVNSRGDWLIIKLLTDEGLEGLGEASHGTFGPGRDATVTTLLEQQCLPLLKGKDPRHVNATLSALRPVARDGGFAAATAVSACEQALWDLAGKAAEVPVYQLLGGPVRDRIPLYANINRATMERQPEAFARNARAAVNEGVRAVKLAPFDGMDRRRIHEREQRQRVQHGLDCVTAVRDAVGSEIDVLVDCHEHFDIPTAVSVGRELYKLGVTWFEEPVPTDDLDSLIRLRSLVPDLQLVGGERLYDVAGFWPYLAVGVWDVVMPDVKHCGGIQQLVGIAQAAGACGVSTAPHNPSGPVAMIASGHVAATLPQMHSLEFAWGEVPWRNNLIHPAESIVAGDLELPAGPGLGISLDETTLAAHQRPGT